MRFVRFRLPVAGLFRSTSWVVRMCLSPPDLITAALGKWSNKDQRRKVKATNQKNDISAVWVRLLWYPEDILIRNPILIAIDGELDENNFSGCDRLQFRPYPLSHPVNCILTHICTLTTLYAVFITVLCACNSTSICNCSCVLCMWLYFYLYL